VARPAGTSTSILSASPLRSSSWGVVPRGGADCYKDAVFYEVHVKASWTQTS